VDFLIGKVESWERIMRPNDSEQRMGEKVKRATKRFQREA